MKVSIYSQRGVRGCGLMGLGPGTDNTTNMLFALLASTPRVTVVGLIVLLSSADKWRSWDSCPRLLIGAM
ncbi:hypothetical protein Hanom_Chr11g01006581 [Helianthus anomalus]